MSDNYCQEKDGATLNSLSLEAKNAVDKYMRMMVELVLVEYQGLSVMGQIEFDIGETIQLIRDESR